MSMTLFTSSKVHWLSKAETFSARAFHPLRDFDSTSNVRYLEEIRGIIQEWLNQRPQPTTEATSVLGKLVSSQCWALLKKYAGLDDSNSFEALYDCINYIYKATNCNEDFLASARLLSETMNSSKTMDELYEAIRPFIGGKPP
jgi:hypothetical protein